MTDYSEFAPNKYAAEGLRKEVEELMDEGRTEAEALREAATVMSGAGDNPKGGTVEAIQTCYALGGNPVKGLTGDDAPLDRNDEFAKNEEERHAAADAGVDDAEAWLMQNDPEYFKRKDQSIVKKHSDRR